MIEIKGKNKKVYLELLRIIAIVCVIFNHTGVDGFFRFSVVDNWVIHDLELAISIFCKIAVPIFFMISGALLIPKEESIKQMYKKRVSKLVAILLIFQTIIFMILIKEKLLQVHTLKYFFTQIFSSQMIYTYWFLYSYLAILMILPFLRRMAQNMTNKEFKYLVVLQIIFVGILPIYQYLYSNGTLQINENLQLPIVTCMNVFFFIMGYFLEHRILEQQYTRKNAVLAIVLSILAIMITCGITNYQFIITGKYQETFFNGFIAIPAFTVYFLVKYFFIKVKVSVKIQKLIVFLGGTAFGIYLLEEFLRKYTMFIYEFLAKYTFPMLACFIWVGIVFFIGVIIVSVLKKLPVFRKLI